MIGSGSAVQCSFEPVILLEAASAGGLFQFKPAIVCRLLALFGHAAIAESAFGDKAEVTEGSFWRKAAVEMLKGKLPVILGQLPC